MPIKIDSKKIFSYQNEKFIKNVASDIVIDETSFSTEQANQRFDVNLEYKRSTGGLNGFGSSEGYKDIQFFTKSGDYNYYVRFNFEAELDEKIFLLRNAKAKVSLIGEQYNPNGIDDDQNGTIDDNEHNDSYSFTNVYSSDAGADLYFSILSKESDFSQIGLMSTIGIYRLSTHRVRIFVILPYYYAYGNVKTTYNRAEIYIYADEQQKNQSGSDGNLFHITDNELISETTYYVPSSARSLERSSPSWFLKIKQHADYDGKYYSVGDSAEKKESVSSGIGNDYYINFYIRNFYINTGLPFNEQTILNLQNCKILYEGHLLNAHLNETLSNLGDGKQIIVKIHLDELKPLGFVTGVSVNPFRFGEKVFYFGYSEGGSGGGEGDDEPTITTKISDVIRNSVTNEWVDGKETAKILCSISNYYSVEGEKIISIDGEKMSFDIGDQVIPMVFGADGIDRPMSKYKDGSAKVFRVVGLKFIYDGAVWQELTLQEV